MTRLAAALALILTLPLPGLAQERLASHCIALAEGPAAAIPARLGEGLEPDRVLIRYLHHASLAIVTPEGIVAVTDYTGLLGTTDLVPDVVTMNNSHGTHWTPDPDPRIPHVLKGWPEGGRPAEHRLDLGAMLVRNVTTDTRGPFGEGARKDGNSIFIFEAGGLCIGHLGHLHTRLSDQQYGAIGRLDILMVPIDGGMTQSLGSMSEIATRLYSSMILPMHRHSTPLGEFLGLMGEGFAVDYRDGRSLEVTLKTLPDRPTIVVLEGV